MPYLSSQHLTLYFEKIPEGAKMDRKSLNYFPGFWLRDLAIFGPFLDLQEFLKNQGLTFETSDSDFCDVLEELFHMVNKTLKKNKIGKFFSKSPIKMCFNC